MIARQLTSVSISWRRWLDNALRNFLSSGDGQWVIPAIALVLVQFVAAIVLSHAVSFGGRPPLVQYALISFVVSLTGGSFILLPKLYRLWSNKEAMPIARLWRDSDHAAVACYLIGGQLIGLQMCALTWLKEMLPWIVPFWADPALASADRSILGTDAWRLVPESLISSLDVIYVTWLPVKMLTLLTILCLPPTRKKAHAMLAYFLTVGLMGVCGQYLLSSAGPVFYDRIVGGSDFADLMARVHAHAAVVGRTVEYLWTSYVAHSDELGNGISAMPSIHVATTAWLALALSSFWRRAGVLASLFWLVIFIGSIGLGWHYFMDSAVGTIGAVGCWALARRMLDRGERRLPNPMLVPAG
jgi:hypothetical protein